MGHQAGADFEAGIESGLTAILSSTKFLFRAEPVRADNAGAGGRDKRRAGVADLEIAVAAWPSCCGAQGPDKALRRRRIGRQAARQRDAARADPSHAEGSTL